MQSWFQTLGISRTSTQPASLQTIVRQNYMQAHTQHILGTGDCDGAVKKPDGQAIKIPCACPPDRGVFIQVFSDYFNVCIQTSRAKHRN